MFKFDPKKIPNSPGVYIFKNESSEVIYIGKAKILKNRVSSYFLKNDDRLYKKYLIVDSIFDIETISTNSEKEALILESNLIKKHKPKYNVLLKDNSEFCFLKINYSKKLYIPTISIVRRQTEKDLDSIDKEKDVYYFGPYLSKKSLFELLSIISKIFPYQCLKVKEINNRFKSGNSIVLSPCFNFHIKKCSGICCGKISREEYFEIINNLILFFSGKIENIEKYIHSKMEYYASLKNYEEAARYRDRLLALNNIIDKQNIRSVDYNSVDILSIYIYDKLACINVFNIKNGVLCGKKNFIIPINKYNSIFLKQDFYLDGDGLSYFDFLRKKIINLFIEQYYLSNLNQNNYKKEIVTKFKIDNNFFDNISIRECKNENEQKLLLMGEQNAIEYINKKEINGAVLEKIKDRLNLDKIPKRMECFDISNISGKYAVGSMVTFINGLPDKNEYRKFKIKNINLKIKNEDPNDFAMMEEVLQRRLSDKNLLEWGWPDLIVLDGGLPQLSTVLKLVEKLKINNPKLKNISIVSLAKREEEIYILNNTSVKLIQAKQLYVLRQMRDEAHRFGITYFRKLYSKQFKIKNLK